MGCARLAQTQDSEEIIVNPTYSQRSDNNYCDAIVAGSGDVIVMIEVEGSEVSNADMVEICKVGMRELGQITNQFESIAHEIGQETISWEQPEFSPVLDQVFNAQFRHVVSSSLGNILDRDTVDFWKSDFKRAVLLEDEKNREQTDVYFEQALKHICLLYTSDAADE